MATCAATNFSLLTHLRPTPSRIAATKTLEVDLSWMEAATMWTYVTLFLHHCKYIWFEFCGTICMGSCSHSMSLDLFHTVLLPLQALLVVPQQSRKKLLDLQQCTQEESGANSRQMWQLTVVRLQVDIQSFVSRFAQRSHQYLMETFWLMRQRRRPRKNAIKIASHSNPFVT